MAAFSRRSLAKGFLSLRRSHGYAKATQALAAVLLTQKKVRDVDFIIREIRRELLLTQKELHVRVVSAHKLSVNLKQSLAKLLQKRSTATSVHAEYAVAPTLKGGFVVDSPTEIIDASVLKQISILNHLF